MIFTTSDIPTRKNSEGIDVPVGGKVVPFGVDGDFIALPPNATVEDIKWTVDGDIKVKGAFYSGSF